MSQEFKVVQVLDAKGKSCPGPIIALKKAIKNLAAGDVLEVQATDPGSVEDFKAWTEETGHLLLDSQRSGGVFTYYVQKTEE
ncbi:MAG: sulfurtransferase TusA family protein [Chloroflexi bacterium]|nr:sulfurtransferase TusA family protein [Chloroflexota bacterium]OJV90044.1 MAG: hypothetical protein BGO39_01305 [Chloroflexi bacterium 54-19]